MSTSPLPPGQQSLSHFLVVLPFISDFIFMCHAFHVSGVYIDSIHSLPYPLAPKDFVATAFRSRVDISVSVC